MKIEEKIKENWSPEQIRGYYKKHKIDMVRHSRIGDWEAGTVVDNNHKVFIVTIVERKTKITLIKRLKNKKAETVKDAIIEKLTTFKKS